MKLNNIYFLLIEAWNTKLSEYEFVSCVDHFYTEVLLLFISIFLFEEMSSHQSFEAVVLCRHSAGLPNRNEVTNR